MEKELDDVRPISMEVAFQIDDGAIALFPNILLIPQLFEKSFIAEKFRMYANHQDFFIVGTIENADVPSRGKAARCAPEKIMLQFLGAWLLETKNFATFGIYAGHDVTDSAILPGRVQSLKDQQQGIAIGGVEKLL